MTYEDLLSLSETNLKRKFLRDGVVDRVVGVVAENVAFRFQLGSRKAGTSAQMRHWKI